MQLTQMNRPMVGKICSCAGAAIVKPDYMLEPLEYLRSNPTSAPRKIAFGDYAVPDNQQETVYDGILRDYTSGRDTTKGCTEDIVRSAWRHAEYSRNGCALSKRDRATTISEIPCLVRTRQL